MTGLTSASIFLVAVWLFFLSYFAIFVISTISILLPVGMISLSTAMLVTSIKQSSFQEFNVLAILSIFGIILSSVISVLLWKNKNLVISHAKIVQLACEILKINPSLFVLSALLTLGHITFTTIWLFLFCQIFYHDSTNDFYIPLFFVIMYFWTSSIFQNLERVTISSVVGEWYFLRFEKNMKGDMTWVHFRHTGYNSFGSVCYASLILGLVRILKFIISFTRRVIYYDLTIAVKFIFGGCLH
jgi:hypothetical protein